LAEKLDTDAQKEKFAEIIGNYFAVNDEKVKGKVSESKANEKLVSGTTYYDYTISSLPAGYYIIKDIGDTTGEGGVGTKYILSVTSNSEVYSKAGQTTLTKEVSKNSSTGFGHSTDSTVGNEVYFQLTATLPEHVEDFASYRLTFEDTLPAGLTYTGIVSAKMALTRQGEVDLPEGSYSVVDANNSEITQFEGDDSTAFYIKTKNLKAYDDLDNLWNTGATVTFVYSAKLNENAQVGGSGNVNTAKLIYTNDPYVYPDSEDKTESDDPEGETPEADAIVFTYAFQGDKVDGEDENNHLSGAEFILYKDGTNEVSYVSEVDAATENIKTWSTMEYGTGKIYASKDEAIEAIINIESGNTGYAHRFVSGDEGLFKISGLGADVTFYLKETKAPAAYSIMTSPFTFKISATRTTDGTGTETLQATDHNSKPLTSNDSKDTILATITNTKGGQLPSTGGMGRTIIYAIGVILTLSAAILLVVKKRMHANF
jgi:fimbrial isopeptide formation D2 family protein/LPXTG-motif cell wall-anchored protein